MTMREELQAKFWSTYDQLPMNERENYLLEVFTEHINCWDINILKDEIEELTQIRDYLRGRR